MAYFRFYSPFQPSYRDENSGSAYEQLVRHINQSDSCGCYRESVPASNVSESDRDFRLEMALPGVDKSNIRITQENGFLTIKVEKPEADENHESYARQEFNYNGASRTFRIGNKIDAENIAAKYENGILSLILPKKDAFVNKPAQSIAVE
jgi:HSP20 family protein